MSLHRIARLWKGCWAVDALPRITAIGSLLCLAGVLGAVIVGYNAYMDLIYSALYWQDLGWLYKLAFWLAIAVVAVLMLLQLAKLWTQSFDAPPYVRTVAGLAPGKSRSSTSDRIVLRTRPARRCPQCLTVLRADERFCTKCGAKAPEDTNSLSSE